MERKQLEQIQKLKQTFISQASFLSKQKSLIEEKYDGLTYDKFSTEDQETIREIQKVRSELKSKLSVLNYVVGESSIIASINFKDIASLKTKLNLRGFPDVKTTETETE